MSGWREERATDDGDAQGIIYGVSLFRESGREASAGQKLETECEKVE